MTQHLTTFVLSQDTISKHGDQTNASSSSTRLLVSLTGHQCQQLWLDLEAFTRVWLLTCLNGLKWERCWERAVLNSVTFTVRRRQLCSGSVPRTTGESNPLSSTWQQDRKVIFKLFSFDSFVSFKSFYRSLNHREGSLKRYSRIQRVYKSVPTLAIASHKKKPILKQFRILFSK